MYFFVCDSDERPWQGIDYASSSCQGTASTRRTARGAGEWHSPAAGRSTSEPTRKGHESVTIPAKRCSQASMEAPICVAVPATCGREKAQFARLPQNYHTANGSWNDKKASREYILLEQQRMCSGFQYYVHQLLRLQQTRRRCCGYGTSSRKVISHKGNIKQSKILLLYSHTSKKR